MQRILFLSTVYPRSYEPTRGTYCFATCKALAEQGHEVRVVSPRSWIECLRQPSPTDKRLVLEAGPTDYPCYYYPPGVLQYTYGWWMWNSIKRPLLRISKSFQPQAILSYWAHPDGYAAVQLAKRLQVPVGIIVGGSDVLILPKNPRRRRVITQTLQTADAVLTVSRDLQEKTVALGVDPAKVHVCYQGVDETFYPGDKVDARKRLQLPIDRELLLWVGKMVPVKGLEVMLAAMEQVVRLRRKSLLLLVGDGPERSKLERIVQQRDLGPHVRFVGAIEPHHLPDWYRAADLFVLSSHSEGIPNVLRESLACGTPYVSTDVGGISELCSHPSIRLVRPNNPIELASNVCHSLKLPTIVPPGLIERGWSKWSENLVEVLIPSTHASACLRPSRGNESQHETCVGASNHG